MMPGLHIRGQGPNGQPVRNTGNCQCACHRDPLTATYPIPKATIARVCPDCADEMFRPWTDLVDQWI